ncbi:MAG: flagellar hook protein FlgE [Lachnospiraceae bacterium]
MMRSLFSGVSGLSVHQTKMDVIGNNIANVNTVAFKSSTVTFNEVFYQTTQMASGPNSQTGAGGQNAKQIGLGTSVGAISTNGIDEDSTSQRTDNPFDLQISGNGFFIVNSGGTNYFTRDGSFKVDGAGNLVTASGAAVMGWQVDEENNIVKDTVSPLAVKSQEFTYTAPAATTACNISGNINKSSSVFVAGGAETMSYRFYDSLGYEYLGTISVTQNPNDSSQYTLQVNNIYCNNKLTNLVATLDATNLNFNPDTGKVLTDTSNFKLSFTTDNTIPDYKLAVNTTINDISLDLSQLTMYGDETSFVSNTGDLNGNGKGKAVGTMSSVGIDGQGRIVANYSNGDTRFLGQVAVATFDNASGLEKKGTNMYAETLNSGHFDGVGEDVTATGGSIASGVLEMSNVDLSSEFTNMITTQRGFQANSRIITVSDSLLEELISLKR